MPFGLNGLRPGPDDMEKRGEEGKGRGKMQAWGWWICR